jgi:L-fuconolactonase
VAGHVNEEEPGTAAMIDAHFHLWRLGRNDCVWPTPDLAAIHRDHELAEITALAGDVGVTSAILVQSQASERDTRWLLELAKDTSFVAGVVGWTDLTAADVGERFDSLAEAGPLVGIRPLAEACPDDWFDAPELEPAFEALVARGLTFDALIRPRHLPSVDRLAARHPGLAIIIDHAAKPRIGVDQVAWREAMAPLATRPNVCCKLSGLMTELEPDGGAEDLPPYIADLLALFGPDRIVWGSDWPVLNLRGSYAEWLACALAAVPAADHPAIFNGNARRFYGLTS